MKGTCLNQVSKIESAQDLDKLTAEWAEFMHQFAHEFETYRLNPSAHDPDLIVAFEQARKFKPKNGQFETLHPQYVQKAKALQHTLDHLPPLQRWGWEI